MPLGDLTIELAGQEEVADYTRALDLRTGVATCVYRVGDVHYERRAFVSAPAQAIVYRLTADRPGQPDGEDFAHVASARRNRGAERPAGDGRRVPVARASEGR